MAEKFTNHGYLETFNRNSPVPAYVLTVGDVLDLLNERDDLREEVAALKIEISTLRPLLKVGPQPTPDHPATYCACLEKAGDNPHCPIHGDPRTPSERERDEHDADVKQTIESVRPF